MTSTLLYEGQYRILDILQQWSMLNTGARWLMVTSDTHDIQLRKCTARQHRFFQESMGLLC